MRKAEARNVFREKRKVLTAAERTKLDDLLLIQFQKLELPFVDTVLTYSPIPANNEPNVHLAVDFLAFRNPALKVAYPKMSPAGLGLQAILVDADTPFIRSTYDVMEPLSDHVIPPDAFDLVIVPLLICDRNGFRVGYGRGYYDRYLRQCRSDCVKIGLQYFEPLDVLEDKDEFDVPLDVCVTPANTYVF